MSDTSPDTLPLSADHPKLNNPLRRGFLTNLIVGGVALPILSTATFAADDKDSDGEERGKGRRPSEGRGKGGRGPDPARVAERLIKDFDKDGDKALNAKELAAAIKAMREQRGRGEGGRGDQDNQDDGKPDGEGPRRGGGKGRGKADGDSVQAAEGVKPKRPPSE